MLLHWHFVVERGEVKGAPTTLYGHALKLLSDRLSPELNHSTAMQTSTIRRLVEVVQSVAHSKRDRLEKIERLRMILSGSVGDPLRVIDPPVLFPIAPHFKARTRARASDGVSCGGGGELTCEYARADVGYCRGDGHAV